MNERQRRLASYLLNAKGYCSQEQIMEDLADYKDNSRLIRSDVRALNNGEFSYIIASTADGYAIATKEEAEAYLNTKRKTALRMLALAEKVNHKLQNNGQLKQNNAGNIIEAKTVCD